MKKAYKFISLFAVITIILIITTAGIDKSSRSGGFKDMVEELYDQALRQNNNLKSIEEDISRFYKKKEDALEKYNSFINYNNRYYTDAKSKAATITDVVHKQRALDLLNKSELAYRSKLSGWQAEINTLSNYENELANLHSLLKIMITEPMMLKYQSSELPDNSKLKEAQADIQKVIEQIKSITK